MINFEDLNAYSKVFGTTLIDEYLLKFLRSTVALRRSTDSSGFWTVSFFNDVLIENFVFDSVEKAREAFHFLPNIFQTEDLVILSKEPLPNNLKEIYIASERLRKLSDIEQRLTKFSYQISGIGSILSSLTEPFPTELILPLFSETVSELFITPVGVYKEMKTHASLIYYVGNYKFSESISIPKINGFIFGKIANGFGYGFEFDGTEGDKFYVLLAKEDFELEEQNILSAIGLVFQKGRELMKTTAVFSENEKLIQQYEFALRSLSEFSVHVLSSKTFDELKKNIVDYIAEIYQAKYVLLYEGKEELKLSFSKSFEKKTFRTLLSWKEIEKEFENVLDYYKLEIMDEKVIILVGEEVIPGYMNQQVKSLLKEIISTEILRAIENVFYQEQLIKEKTIVEFYNTVISFIIENYISFQEMSPEEVLSIFETYSKNFFPFVIKGISLYNKYKYGQTEGLDELVISNITSPYGKVYYEKRRALSSDDERVLILVSIVLFTTIEYSILLNKDEFTKEDILKFAEFRYLRKSQDEFAIVEGRKEFATVYIDLDGKQYSILPKIYLE